MWVVSGLCSVFLLVCTFMPSEGQVGITVPNFIHFPFGAPYMGLIIALATPLDLQNIDAFVAVSFEAAYNLPTNETNFTYPPILSRAFDFINRKSLYEVLETRIEKFGYEGKQCLLRAICEATTSTFDHNGVLGDLVNLLLKPSTTINNELSSDYGEAEEFGKRNANCGKYKEKCSTSLLDLLSV